MAQKPDASLQAKLDHLQNQEGKLDPQPVINSQYRPNKRRRAIRREVYTRWYQIRDDPLRKEAEAQWELGDKEYNMYIPEIDPDDWQSHLQLPDAFAAIQAQAQETVERKARPGLTATDETKEPVEQFANSVMNYNMTNTGFDYQYFMAKLSGSIRGTYFLMDYWRTDKRVVKDPTGLKADGTIEYKDKEIIDFDDDYTEWVPNEFIYVDEKAKHIDEAVDMFRRRIINVDEFYRIYGNKPGFYDTEYVFAGGDRGNRSFFQKPADITEQDVEVLEYYNRAFDAYWCVANNVTIYDGPLPSKHKELPLAVGYQYRVPGQFWGLGIPKVIHYLSEERKSIRNLNMDRQKIIIGGAFIHNSAFDIDDEDTTIYPGKIMSIDTNGQPITNAITQMQMGDVPASYFRTEEILLEDIRRAHGIDDRIQGVQAGGTATEAAILKESSLKRVNLISITAEMDTIIRIGKLKWSNIQFFYGVPRMEKIVEEGEETEKKVYRTMAVQGKKFQIVDNGTGGKSLDMEDVKGNSAVTLKPEYAKYLEGNFDISVDAEIFTPISKAIEQTKKTELWTAMIGNPAVLAVMDVVGSTTDVMKVNNIDPEVWLKNTASKHDMMMLAESENMVMLAGQPLAGTKDATEDHTLVHLMFTKTQDYLSAPHEIQQIIQDHILQEHDNNPATGSSADLMGAYGLGGQGGPGSPSGPGQPVGQAPAIPLPAPGAQPQAQVADLQPTNFSNPK